ncbi:MAG: metallophosphoesterase [Thermoplasmata archaeon]
MSKTACIIADLHGYAPTMKYLKQIATGKCDYLIIAGDITSADMGNSAEPVFNFLDSLNIPVMAVLGNSGKLEFLYEFQTL